MIKSHHNVGGLPDYVDFKEIIEPLRMLFKDEVRAAGPGAGPAGVSGHASALPRPRSGHPLSWAISRKEKLDILRDADVIFREEVAKAGLDSSISQYFAVLTNMRSVGVMGDGRTYDYTAGPARRHHQRLYDRRLGPHPLRCAGPGSPSASSTRCPSINRIVLRYYLQTPRNH